MRFLALLLALATISAVGPPQLPPLPGNVVQRPVKRLASPRAQATSSKGALMARPAVVVAPKPKVVTLAADFAKTGIVGASAFIDVSTNLTSWQRIATLPYPTNGGTLMAPYTNSSPQLYFRAGFTLPSR